jgi:hypothetical protein
MDGKPSLRTKIITRMISLWISHPGKSPESWRECSFQISHKRLLSEGWGRKARGSTIVGKNIKREDVWSFT